MRSRWLVPTLLIALAPVLLKAGPVTVLDFEDLADSDIVINQYPGLTFSNAIILSAGISLNEFEFPPHSGVNVVSDNGGPLSISFATPITSFSGYFTYAEMLTLQGFDAGSNLVGSTSSAFTNNMVLSGEPGSSPNEFMSLSFAGGISSITITGDTQGGSLVMDDTTIQQASSPVPEPQSVSLLVCGFATLSIIKCLKSRS